jgi:beta-lactamase regulating signal transducer with metallopeptidase domain
VTQWLLGTLVATSGLIVLILLAREPVRRHFGARVAYGLWLIPAARLLMPTLTETVERPVALRTPLISNVGVPELEHVVSPVVPVGLWVMGALALLAAGMIQFRRQRRAILAAAEEVGRSGSIRIVSSTAVRGPVAFGIVDRVIAVPADFATRYDAHECRLALDHELAHHRSGDLIANFLAFILLCLQWFNPLAWVAHAAFRFDQEAACDARVLDSANGLNRADYGRTIAKAASGRTLLFAGALDRPDTLRRRLKCMFRDAAPGRRRIGMLLILAGAVLALPLTATRAINYVDALPADKVYQTVPDHPGSLAAPVPDARAMTVQARVNTERGGLETDHTGEARRAQERALSDAERAWRNQERTRTDPEQVRRDEEQHRRALEQALRQQVQARRDIERAREQRLREVDREREGVRRDAIQPQREQEQARRVVAQAQRDQEQRRADFEQAQEQARRSEQQAKELYLRDVDRALTVRVQDGSDE